MSTKQDTTITNIMAALEAHKKAKAQKAADHPMADRTLEDLTLNAGILKSGDKYPAKNMAPESEAGFEMEVNRTTAMKAEKAEKVNRQRQRQRRAAARKVAFDQIAKAPIKPAPERMEQAWFVVHPLVPIINKIALSKQRWAARFLGSVADDVPSIAMEQTALVLAKGSHNLGDLRVAAEQLGGMVRRTNMVPGDQIDDDERAERKRDAKNRKMLMGLLNNRVMGALVDVYTNERNLKWENLDMIATTMANINGVGEDPMTARFKADRSPSFMASRFPKPGKMDPAVLATAISAAITELGLDPITEILLDEDNRRVDGSVKWTACARDIFLATPDGKGEWMWNMVCSATEHLKKPRAARGNAAMIHTRNLFEWLPFLIGNVVGSMDQHMIGWSPTGHRAVLASDFELFYMPDARQPRELLQPVLKYASVEEAARVLAESMGALMTNEDYMEALVNE